MGDPRDDVQALQTAAGLEAVAVQAYRTALSLPFIGGRTANPAIRTFVAATLTQHEAHRADFVAALRHIDGTARTKPDPSAQKRLRAATPGLKAPRDVVALVLALEDVAAQTYAHDTGVVGTPDLRRLFVGVAGVEAQHKAVLLVVQALLRSGRGAAVTLPLDTATLPGALGSVGVPDTFCPTVSAVPASDGAVR